MKRILPAAILLLLFIACQNARDKEQNLKGEYTEERHAFFSNIMAPAEAAAQLKATGAEFNAGLMSDANNFSIYTRNPVKAAANLGIYLSDLNYSLAFEVVESTKQYFMAAHELSRAIGAEQEVLAFLMKRYNDNLSTNDSVRTIVNALLKASTGMAEGTARENLAGIAMAAYQIENLHLALGTIRSYTKDTITSDNRTIILAPLLEMVLRQRVIVENIYSFLKEVTDPANPDKNPNFLYYTNAFEELIAVYKKINTVDRISKKHISELIDDPALNELIDKTDVIRSKVISPD